MNLCFLVQCSDTRLPYTDAGHWYPRPEPGGSRLHAVIPAATFWGALVPLFDPPRTPVPLRDHTAHWTASENMHMFMHVHVPTHVIEQRRSK